MSGGRDDAMPLIDDATIRLGRERHARAAKTRLSHVTPVREGLTARHEGDGRLVFELRLTLRATYQPGDPLARLIADAQRMLTCDIEDAARVAEQFAEAMEDNP